MSKKRKSYSAEFKQDGVSQIAQAKTITGLAKELGVRRKFLYLWRDSCRQAGRRWSDAGADRQGAIENRLPSNAQCS